MAPSTIFQKKVNQKADSLMTFNSPKLHNQEQSVSPDQVCQM